MLMAQQPRFISFRSLVACALLAAGPGVASAQSTVSEFSEQKLDRVDVIERSGATNVALDIEAMTATKPWVATDYPAVSSTTGFTACQNTSTRGLYCLDGNVIRRWPNPEKAPPLLPVDGRELFNCGNSVFGFDRDNVCTAMTVDLAGNIWIAGKKKSKFSLFKVVTGACPSTPANTAASTWKPFTTASGAFCAREYASGRPLLVDLSVVDGDVAEAFPYSEGGVFGVEERREITFFPDMPQQTPVVIGAGKDWGLAGGEQLQAVTLLQQPSLTPARNWLLVTTSTGRLLSREIPYPGDPLFQVVNHSSPTGNAVNLVSATTCLATLTPYYDIRTSVKTRSTYVSDRRGCRLMSLKSNIDTVGFGATTALSFATPPEVIASTSPTSTLVATLTAPPEGVSIAPGIEVDLRADCGFMPDGVTPKECGIVPDGGDTGFLPAAALQGVKIDSGTPSGLTVFQIQNIPECRYLPYGTVGVCTPVLNTTTNVWSGAIVKPDGTVARYPNDYEERTVGIFFPRNPETLYLDVSKLMPPEVTKVTTLPRMLMSPRYRGLPDRNTFDALFGITDDGVRFRETWLGKLDLRDLIPGRKLGCGGTSAMNDPDWATSGPPWDAVVTISERFTTVGGPLSASPQHTDMLVNTERPDALCTDIDPPISGSRWSLYAYGVKLAADRRVTPDPMVAGDTGLRYSDSIFAKLVLSLFDDLGKTIDQYLCPTTGPLVSNCSTLKANWVNTQDKLQKCVESSTEPLNSTQIRTCNAFEVQYAPFAAQVTGLPQPAPGSTIDPANRIGETKARLEVFRYVYDKQFVPSIPPQGFNDGLYQ